MPRIGMLKQEKEEFKASLIKELKKKKRQYDLERWFSQ